MISYPSKQLLMFYTHLLIVRVLFLLFFERRYLLLGSISSQINKLKPSIIWKSDHQAILIFYWNYVHKKWSSCCFGCPYQLNILINHKIVTKGAHYKAKTGWIMKIRESLSSNLMSNPFFVFVNVKVFRNMISFEARRSIFESPLIPYSSIRFIKYK